MNHDDATTGADRRFTQAGPGLASARMCTDCRKPKSQRGGKLIGKVKRFRCAECVTAAAQRLAGPGR